MSFHVDPPAVTAFAAAMSGLAGSTDSAYAYADKHLTTAAGSTGPLWHAARDAIDATKAAILATLSHQGELADASAEELYAAAEMYRAIDGKAAATMDAALPPR